MSEQKRRNEAAHAEIRKFLTALSAGQAAAVDRFNRKIEVGQKLLVSTPVDLVFDVVGIAPVLDPQAPPGLINVQVTVTVPITVQANRPAQNVIIIGEAAPQATAADSTQKADDHVAVPRPTLVLTDPPEAESPAPVQADCPNGDSPADPRD